MDRAHLSGVQYGTGGNESARLRSRPLHGDQDRQLEAAQVHFEIPGPPVGKNRRHHKTKRLTDEAREYLARIKNIGFAAAIIARWRCVSEPRCLELEVITYNTKHDHDAALPIICDGLEGVIYENDRSIKRSVVGVESDQGPARVAVTVRRLRPDAVSSHLS